MQIELGSDGSPPPSLQNWYTTNTNTNLDLFPDLYISSKKITLGSNELENNTWTWLRECCRQGEAGVVSYSRNKLHQTKYKYYFQPPAFAYTHKDTWLKISSKLAEIWILSRGPKMMLGPQFQFLRPTIDVIIFSCNMHIHDQKGDRELLGPIIHRLTLPVHLVVVLATVIHPFNWNWCICNAVLGCIWAFSIAAAIAAAAIILIAVWCTWTDSTKIGFSHWNQRRVRECDR